MSTSFRVTGQGARLTRRKIEAIAKQGGGSVDVDPEDGHLIVSIAGGFVHHYSRMPDDPKAGWNGFERFGANYAACDQWIEYLNASGYSVLSEHDEDFWGNGSRR